jgi:uncharacterized protein DUF3576
MPVAYYRLLLVLAASISLALSGCGGDRPAAPPGAPVAQKAAADESDEIDTEATIWTVLGIAKKPPRKQFGPKTGPTVSPILYQATLDTFKFVKLTSADPVGGSLVTDWYSPAGKPDERYKANIFVLARALRSDAIAVRVERQARQPSGEWADTPVDRSVQDSLEAAILTRARELRHLWYPEEQ